MEQASLQQNHSISIHALREEGDRYKLILSGTPVQFLSTPSARRATVERECVVERKDDFYPRPPRGGRLARAEDKADSWYFYPRPPRGGRQLCKCR